MPILDEWMEDIPQQFKAKHNIEVLFGAFAKQLDELHKVLDDVNALTDIDTAIGVNLDNVGNIISFSRIDAKIKSGSSSEIIDDETYRKYLKLQRLINTSECTYADIMDGIDLLWGLSPVYYIEDADYPATIFLKVPSLSDSMVSKDDVVQIFKPAGVRVELFSAKWGEIADRTWGSLSTTKWGKI